MMDEMKLLKTGTTTVGIVCKDAVILAADRKATMGDLVSNKKMKKVVIINDSIAVTTAGLVSDIQLLIRLVRAQINLDELRKGKKLRVKEVVNLLGNLVYNNIRKFSTIPGITGFLVAGRDNTGLSLYELGADGSLIKYEDYATDGSGMVFALGVLEANYKENLSVEDGVKLVVSAVNAAIQRDTNSGCGVDVVVISKDSVKEVFGKQLETKLTV